jgi:hypothetical protein
MSKALLVTAASILALCATGALAAGSVRPLPAGKAISFKTAKAGQVLWDQTSNYAGEAVTSENFTSTGSDYDDQAADDFVIPKGKVWKITEIDVVGVYGSGGAPALSENVSFHKDANGMPGKIIKKADYNYLRGVDSNGSFAITLPKAGVRLKAGRYWISVVANFEFGAGTWGWELNTTQRGGLAMWQNPGDALGLCETWCTLKYLGYTAPDLVFELKGASKNG